MKIAIVTPYGNTYSNDRLFDLSSCKIGQNLLLPCIKLKERLEDMGHEFHTADMYDNIEDIDVWVFQDLNNDSRLTINTILDWIKYILKKKWKQDYLYKIRSITNKRRVLIMQEPQTVLPQSYDINNHQYFDCILTWNDSLVDGIKYIKFLYPQVKPDNLFQCPYEEKKFLTMICGNKTSSDYNELYSERLKVIEYCEKNDIPFDLYGFGWNIKERSSYRGVVNNKLNTLSKYKFSICFENMKTEGAYITEKIFDCFFSGCIPIYYGSKVISDYIPEEIFIDYRNFDNLDELIEYLQKMTELEYMEKLSRVKAYLESENYINSFSVEAYVDRMIKAILG